jgi:hypothetical protein
MTQSQSEYIAEKARDEVSNSLIAEVTKVFVHDEQSDSSNHEVNCRVVNDTEEFRRIPVHVGQPGEAIVPQQGDFVEVSFIDSATQSAFVSDFVYTDQTRAPLGREGHWRRRFGQNDDLFIEAEPNDHSAGDPNVIRLGKKSDGLSDPTTTIELDDSGAVTAIRLSTDGRVTIEDVDGGSVTIEDGTAQIDGATVKLGAGGTGVITDIETTTDADGHVTSVTPVRSNVVETE